MTSREEQPHWQFDADTEVPEDSRPLCKKCGYSLRGLSENRCPECGREFDPEVSISFTTSSEPANFKLLWFTLGPPGKFTYIVMMLFVAGIWISCSLPGGWMPIFFVLYPLAFVVFGLLVGTMLALGWMLIQPQVIGRWRKIKRCLGVPAILVLGIVVAYFEIPLYTTFFISLWDMDSVAQKCVSSSKASPTPRRIGIYGVSRFEVFPGGMQFAVNGAGFLDQEGFAYSPNAPPVSVNERIYRHFYGPWYRWTEFF